MQIYVDPFLDQETMEEQITIALSHLSKFLSCINDFSQILSYTGGGAYPTPSEGWKHHHQYMIKFVRSR